MFSFTFFLFSIFAAIGTGILAGVSDFRGLKIPNGYSAVVLGLFPLCYAILFVLGNVSVFQSIGSHVLAMVLVFALTAALYNFKLLGAADSKLSSAFAFWVGMKGVMAFLFYMTIFGAVLALAALFLRRFKPVKKPLAGSWIDVVQGGESKVPYGIAITVGAVCAFVHLGYVVPLHLVNVFNL